MTHEWKLGAACRGTDLEIWFSDNKDDIREAKAICARCPVRAECLADANRRDLAIPYGVRAGLTGAERKSLRRRSRVEASVP